MSRDGRPDALAPELMPYVDQIEQVLVEMDLIDGCMYVTDSSTVGDILMDEDLAEFSQRLGVEVAIADYIDDIAAKLRADGL